MKRLWKLARPLTLVMMMAALCLVPQQAAAADDDDPPSRVARLSYTRGSVSFQPAGEEEWVSTVVNRPMTTGDKLWVDQGARAELHIGSAAIRLGEDTGFSFLDLNDQVTQIRVTAGTIYVRLRELDPDELFEVDTPNLAFSLLRAGEYRIEVNDAGDVTRVTVRGGEGEATGGGEAFSVHAGQTVEFRGNDQLEMAFDRAGRDDFDEWCEERNRREDKSRSAEYVSRDVIGYEDLDDYGEWRTESEYGHVWRPRTVSVGWAPYRYGHWAWIWPWGWTWVDDAPWGFAPFHYGRWVFVRGYWGWIPGPVRVRPVYAPALVAWVGGPHFGVGITVGRAGPPVGWFPLGPREVFIPSYRVSQRYVTRVNVTNTTVNNVYVTNVYNNYTTNKVTNIRYVNRERVTVTSHTAFTSAQPVGRNLVKVDRRQIRSAQATGAMNVTPQGRSVLGAGNPGARRPPERIVTREVVVRKAPPPRPVPFAVQQKAIEASGGRVPDRQELERMRQPEGEGGRRNVRIAPPIRSGKRVAPGDTRPAAPAAPPTPAAPQAGKPAPGMTERPEPPRVERPGTTPREERPMPAGPAERPQVTGQPAERPTVRPKATPSERPPQNQRQIERQEQLQRRQQGEQQKLQQKQVEQRQQLEQKHKEQELKTRQQPGNVRQQQEQQKLQQQQEQERGKLEQRQQQQRQKEQKQEAKQKQKQKQKEEKKEKPNKDRPPSR